jgi:GNAT superfamily N-acetyltransferase/Fe-S cluster biogenesis protein NfuA
MPNAMTVLDEKPKTRIATPSDIPALCDLLAILFSQEAEFAPDRRRQEIGLKMILDDPSRGEILVAEQDGQVIGMVSILYTVSTFLGAKAGLLEDMIVHPGHRGRKVGKTILDAAIAHARHNGCARLTLLTDTANERAIAFYARCGFARSAMIPLRIHCQADHWNPIPTAAMAPVRAATLTGESAVLETTASAPFPDLSRLAADLSAEQLSLIDEVIRAARPGIQQDGGDIELMAVTADVVRVRLSGACVHCALAGQTLGTIRRQIVAKLGIPLRVLPAQIE